ncbi:MAG: hypothetical protein SCK70_05955, partial [bacterium]|nr:hypothetical protein [bacterium]
CAGVSRCHGERKACSHRSSGSSDCRRMLAACRSSREIQQALHIPQLIGRTDQWVAIDSIITDLTGITSAKNIFSSIEVKRRAREVN